MSRSVEELVAQVSFQNKDFEKYANQTIETLGRFEQAIGRVVTGTDLKGATSNIVSGMKTISDQIEQTGRKYSWLEQIAIGAYRKIGESVLNYGKNEIMKLTGISQAAAGWQKYESEVESVQTIMNATGLKIEEVEKHLKKLGWYTDETSYKYGDMVANIAKFNAAGITDLEQATDSMIGIANMAGYFGVSANKATGAMEGFAKAMGMGYMDLQSWRRVETAQMNAMTIQKAFLDTAVELGKIRKKNKDTYIYGSGKLAKEFKASEFKNVLKYKWMDQEVMSTTFQKYSLAVNDVYKAWLEGGEIDQVSELIDQLGDSLDTTSRDAFKAAQQAKTFTDVVGSLEEVVASGWRTSFKYIFGNYEEARDLWTDVVNELWDIFADSGYKRNDLLKGWYEGGGRDKLLEGVANMWYGFMAIVEPIKKAFDTIFPATTIERLLKLTEAFRKFSEKFRSWFDFGFSPKKEDNVEKTVEKLETFEDAVARTKKNLDKLYNEVNAGKWGHMWDRWKALGEAGYVWQIVQNEVNKRYTEAGVGNYPNRYKVVDDGTVKLKKKTVKATEEETEATNKMTAAQLMAERRSDNLMRAMRGLFAAVDIVKDVFEELGKFFGKTFGKTIEKLSPTFDRILRKAGKFGDMIYLLRDKLTKLKIEEIFESASEGISTAIAWFMNDAIPAIGKGIGFVADKIKTVADVLYPIIEVILGGAFMFVTSLPGWIKKGYQKAKPFFDGLKNYVQPTIDFIKNWIYNDALPFIKELPNTFLPWITDTYNKVRTYITNVWDSVLNSEGFKKLSGSLKSTWAAIKDFGKGVWDYLKETGSEIYKSFDEFFKTYKTEEGSFDWSKLTADGIDWIMDKLSSIITLAGNALSNLKEMFKLFDENGEAKGVMTMTASIEGTAGKLENFGTKHLQPIIDLFQQAFEWLKHINEVLNDPVGTTIELLQNTATNIANMFEGLTLERLSSFFKDTGLGLFFAALAKNMATGAISIASIPSGFAKVLFAVKDVLVSYSKSINANAILKIAKALGILTLAFIGLSAIPPQQLSDITATVLSLGLVAALIVRMLAVYEKFRKVQDIVQNPIQVNGTYDFNGAAMATALVQPLREFFTTLGFQVGKTFKSIGRSVRIVSLALGIITIFKAFKDMYDFVSQLDLDDHRVVNSLWAAGTAVVALGALLVIISTWSKKFDNNATVGGALSFLTMALAVDILMKVIRKVAQWDTSEINNAWAAVMMVSAALIAIAFAVKLVQTKSMKLANGSSSKSSNHVLQLAFIIAAFAAGFALISVSLIALGSMNPGSLLISLIVLGVFALIVEAMASVAKSLGDNSKTILKGVAAIGGVLLLATLMITMFSVLGGLMTLTNGWGNLLWGGLAVVGVLAAIALMAQLMQNTGANAALSSFAESMSKFGFGVVAFAAAVYIFSQAAPALIDAIVLVGQRLNDPSTRAGFITGIIAIGTAIIAAILIMKPTILQGIFGFIKGVFGKTFSFLTGHLKPLLDKLTGLFTTVAGWFNGTGKYIIGAGLILLIWAIFDFLDGIIPAAVDRLIKLLLLIIQSFAKTIMTRSGQIIDALVNVFHALVFLLLEAIKGVIKALFGWLPGAEKKIDDAFEGLFGGIGDTITKNIDEDIADLQSETSRFEDEAVKTIDNTKKNIANRSSGLIDMSGSFGFSGITGGGNAAMNNMVKGPSYDLRTIVKGNQFDLTSILGGGKENIFNSSTEAFSAIPDAIKEQFGVAEMDADSGMFRINEIITNSEPIVASSSRETAQAGVDATSNTISTDTTIQGAVNAQAGEVVKGFMLHVKGWKESVKQAVDEGIKQPAISAMDGLPAEMERRGIFAVQGFVNGVTSRSATAAIWAAGSGVTKKFLSSYDITSGTESPAKTMIWRGLMAVLGFVKGVTDNLGQAQMAGSTLAVSMLSATTDILESSGDLTPTITPVLNTSGIGYGIGRINTMFGQSTLSTALASDAFKGFNQNQMLKQEQIQNINSTNADVVSALGLLRGDVNSLNDSFLNTQVVLDSGALVGATARQMDGALGRLNTYKGRGI